MSTFKASSGVEVTLQDDGSLRFSAVEVEAQRTEAAREYFQWERDQELGRWRDPVNPDYVVYPDVHRLYISQPAIIVINEKTGGVADCSEDGSVSSYGVGAKDSENWLVTAERYFEAHPEKKEWHDAAAGEVWVITVDGEELLCRSNSDGDFTPVFGHHHWATISNGSRVITAGRRIWPEEGGASKK